MAEKPTYEELQQKVKELEQETEKYRQAEVTLRESKHQAQQYFAIAGVIFLTLDKNGKITLINECGLETLGYRREELLGKNWFTTCLPDRFQESVVDVYHQLMRGEIEPVEYYQNPILRKDGKERIIAWHNTILRNPGGEIVGTLSSGEDVTARLKADKQLKEASSIINRSPSVAFLWKNQEGWPVEFVSVNVTKLFGYSADDFVSGKVSYAEVIHPEDIARVAKEVATYSRERGRSKFIHEPYRINTKNGEVKYIDDSTYIRRNQKGRISHYEGIVTDITERKEIEEALRRSEESYRAIVEDMPALVCRFLADGTLSFVNSSYCQYFNKNREELVGENFFQFIPKKDRENVRRHFQSLSQENSVVNYAHQVFAPNGEIHWQQWTDRALFDDQGKLTQYQSIGLDITDRIQAEEALRESEEKFRNIVESTPLGIHMYNLEPDGRLIFTDANPAADAILGIDNKQFIGKTVEEAFPASVKLKIPERYRRVCETGEPWQTEQLAYEDGQISGAFEVHAFQTGPGKMASMFRDITEHRQLEEAMRESEKRFRQLVENIEEVFWVVSPDWNEVHYISPTYEKVWGCSCESLYEQPRSWLDYVIEEDREQIIAAINRKSAGDLSDKTFPEYRIVRPDGSTRWISARAFEIRDENGEIYRIAGIAEDISEHKKAEAALRENEKTLALHAEHLKEVNTALKVLLEHREEEKKQSDENMLINLKKLILPYIEKIEKSNLNEKNATYLGIIKSNLSELISPFANKLSSKFFEFTPSEIQIANLIKYGKTSKEIASLLNVSPKAISFHRGNIRKKLGLANKKINLRSYLQSFPSLESL